MKKLLHLLMVIVAMISVSFVSTGCTSDLDELDGQSFKKILVGEWTRSGETQIKFNSNGTFEARNSKVVGLNSGKWEVSNDLILKVKGKDYSDTEIIRTMQVRLESDEDGYTMYTDYYGYSLFKRK